MWHLEEYVQMYKRNETMIDTKLKILHSSDNSPVVVSVVIVGVNENYLEAPVASISSLQPKVALFGCISFISC